MILSLKILVAIIFVVTGGAVFTDWGRRHSVLAVAAAIVAIIGSYYLARSLHDDFKQEIASEISQSNQYARPYINCGQQLFPVWQNSPICGFDLTAEGEIKYKDRIISEPIVVSYGSDGTRVMAGSLTIFPSSGSGRFAYIQACERQREKQPGIAPLCWKQFMFDAKTTKLKPVVVGKYGPRPHTYWAPDGGLMALFYRNEGIDRIFVVNPENGQQMEFGNSPNSDSYVIDDTTFKWTGLREFTVKIASCRFQGTPLCGTINRQTETTSRKFVVTGAGIELLG